MPEIYVNNYTVCGDTDFLSYIYDTYSHDDIKDRSTEDVDKISLIGEML
jgi:hypothetical protein